MVKLKAAVKKAHARMEAEPELALADLDRVLVKDPSDSMAHFVRGLVLAFHLDRAKEGRVSLERAYRDVVTNGYFAPEVHTSFANCLIALGRLDDARRVLDRCLATYPDEVDAWINRSNLSKEQGNLAAALADLAEAAEREPGNPVVLYNRACYLALEGKKKEALDALEAAVAATPDDAESARQDDDFRSLRKDARFIAITTR